ncbi:MAG: hypothetical protein QOH67_407 [Hyphomicrobiales bacterium]|nr:hypothetical protein [Hyphomicrobiales bacterium]
MWLRLCCFAAAMSATATLLSSVSPARADEEPVPCARPESQNLVTPPVLDAEKNVLEGTILLTEVPQRMPPAQKDDTTCHSGVLRTFVGVDKNGTRLEAPQAEPGSPKYSDPIPGPTLRARVGDRIQLKFVNDVDPNNFEKNNDLGACIRLGENGKTYPGTFDVAPNCLHASSTANIHFHGTHTNPNSAGDNVFLHIRPLPRAFGELTTKPGDVTALFDDFFKTCAEQLKDPLSRWPTTWEDMRRVMDNGQANPRWIDTQEKLLKEYQEKNPTQTLWTKNQESIAAGLWPDYYIGAYPYCFVLPVYTAKVFPPPQGPMMGQAPGTHWYHAHKHGSTAINVMNGMTGAFIIEGDYDDRLNELFEPYRLAGDKPWNTRAQPVLVLNQLGVGLRVNRMLPGAVRSQRRPSVKDREDIKRSPAPDFSVNGRARPLVQMQPGEIQFWRIINTSGRSAAYIMAPTQGLQWRQTAQDGVQLHTDNYLKSHNKPLYLAPGNRADLLVRAPLAVRKTAIEVRVQEVMARANVVPTPAKPTDDDPVPGTPLMTVVVDGPPVSRDGGPSDMKFPARLPDPPVFLANITDQEWITGGRRERSLEFNSGNPRTPGQHTIERIQFGHKDAHVDVDLGAVEEWTIKNLTTALTTGPIDHPFHIHINPFQVTEVFDPNENLTDPDTGQLVADSVTVNGKQVTKPVPKYVLSGQPKREGQCVLDPADPKTWQPCDKSRRAYPVWWDVFAIPSGLSAPTTADPNNVIPGYFKMRSRFVDFPGQYVLHCHILIHEDLGMMFTVSVSEPKRKHNH